MCGFITWVAIAHLLSTGLIASRRTIASLVQGLQYLRWTLLRHCSEEKHHEIPGSIRGNTIVRLPGRDRIRKSLWQYKLDTFRPLDINVREMKRQLNDFVSDIIL